MTQKAAPPVVATVRLVSTLATPKMLYSVKP